MSALVRIERALGAVAVVLVATALLFAAVEAASGVLLDHVVRSSAWRDRSDDDLRRLYPGEKLSVVKEILRETWRGDIVAYSPFVEFRSAEYHGAYVNVQREGYRSRVPLPWPPGPGSILVFGGSTSFGIGVDDRQTIASYLAKYFPANKAIYNLAAPAHFSTSERTCFINLLSNGSRPAAAVFIDGLNDFYFYAVPDRSAFSNRLEAASHVDSIYIAKKVVTSLATSKLMFRLLGRDATSVLFRPVATESEIEKATLRLKTNRRAVAAVCREFGVQCVFVTQPVPTFEYDNAQRPVSIDLTRIDYLPATNCAKGYRRLLAAGDDPGVDHLFLGRLAVDEPVYIDSFHYSPATNEAIAGAIACRLRGALHSSNQF